MGSSGGSSEIVESIEGCNFGNLSTRSRPLRIKVREGEGKSHGYPIKDDLSHLIEAIDFRTSPRTLGAPHQISSDKQRDDACKKPIRVCALQESGLGISEVVTLKQALRRLCISQASEQAALRRSSRPVGLSRISEAGTIKRMFASVIVEGGKADLSIVEGKRKVEVSVERESMASNASQKINQVCDVCSAELSTKKPVASPIIATAVANATKTRIQDVISGTSKASSTSNTTKIRIQDVLATTPTKSRGHLLLSSDLVTKRKTNVKTKSSCERDSCVSKPSTSPRVTKTPFRDNLPFHKKGKQEAEAASGTADRIINPHELGKSSGKANLICRTPVSPTTATMMHSDVADVKSKNNVNDKCYSDPNNCCSSGKSTSARLNKTLRSREKGDGSQSSISSIGDYSSSTSISSESLQSGSSCNAVRPHMSKDVKWVAIRHVLSRNGGLGLMNFKLIKKLGCGDIGTVYLAELTGSGCLFALKVMDVEFLLSRKKMLRAQSEREILQILDHPFLPTLYAHFTTDNLSCLVMEYCPGGDLHVLRQKQPGRRFSEPAARFYVTEVLLALEYLHMLGVIYRDLKPENILVREDGHIMLSDFDLSLRCTASPTLLRSSSLGREEAARKLSGPCAESSCISPYCLDPSLSQVSCFTPRLLSSSMKNKKIRSDSNTQISPLPQLVVEPTDARSNSFVGTHEYLAPEIIKGDGHGSAVDWWTYGIFLYELLYGRTPFKGSGNEETLANVVSQSLKFPDTQAVSVHAIDLIKGLLVKDPEHRLGSVKGAAEIKRHPFFEGLNWALIRCAAPPEVPGSFDPGTPPVMNKKKEAKCLDFGKNGEDVEIELF